MNSPQPAPGPAPGSPAQGRNWTRRLVNVLVAVVVVAVAGATFVFSYAGVHAVALLGGVSAQLARYYPGLFDAVLVIACVAAVVLRDGRWWARLWAWLVLIIVLGAIGTADVLHAMNYALEHRPTEGIVAAAPVAVVLLAFSLLLTLLRQSRTPAPPASAATPVDVPALPASVSAGPIALPAAPATSAAVDSSATGTARPTVPVPVPVSVPVPGVKPAPPTVPVPVPGGSSVAAEASAPGDVTAGDVPVWEVVPWNEMADDQDAALAGAVAPEAHQPTKPNEVIPDAAATAAAAESAGEPEPPTVAQPSVEPPTVEPPTVEVPGVTPPRSHGIRYAGGNRNAPPRADYWETEDKEQFAGVVYRAHGDDDDDEDAATDGPGARPNPPEFDDDAPPFATAPFASMPRLNRVRSMPTPPADEDE